MQWINKSMYAFFILAMLSNSLTATAQERTTQQATILKVANYTSATIEIRINTGTGRTTSFLFQNGAGHFEPISLAPGLGDRVVSVWAITPQGAIVLPAKVLALKKFNPADFNDPVVELAFIAGTKSNDIIFTPSKTISGLGDTFAEKHPELSPEQQKMVTETRKSPLLKISDN